MQFDQNNLMPTSKIQIRRRILLLVFVLLMFPLFFISKNVFVGLTQTINKKEKKFTKENLKNEPVEFVDLKSNGKKFKLDEKSTQEEEWLKDFTIDFKNISGKPITYVSMTITFPETRSTGNTMTYFINYGVLPNTPNKNNDQPKLLAPNKIAQVALSPERYGKLKNFLATRNHALTDLTEARLRIMSVYFEDGTRWNAGAISRPDPNKPGRYIYDDNHQENLK